jgi:hypothetical protein
MEASLVDYQTRKDGIEKSAQWFGCAPTMAFYQHGASPLSE